MMALSARDSALRGVNLPNASIPRPGRCAFSLCLGIALLVILVDAVLHPGGVTSLWTTRTLGSLIGSQGTLVAATVSFAIALVAAGRRRPWQRG